MVDAENPVNEGLEDAGDEEQVQSLVNDKEMLDVEAAGCNK